MSGSCWSTPSRRALTLALAAGLALAGRPAAAQDAPASLSIEDAVAMARLHNPDFLAQQNDESDAEWGVREAYGQLLPGASASTGFQYQAEGSPRYGTLTSEDIGLSSSPSYYFSDYSLGLNYRLGGATFARIGQQKATRRAARAQTTAAGFLLRAEVTSRYLAVKRAADAVELSRRMLERADENLRLAEARVSVGAAIPLEQTQAEVERGRAEVAVLQAENQLDTQRLRLEQVLGADLPDEVALTSEFEIFDPSWSEDALLRRALDGHPQLQALRASEDAGEAAVKMARSSYLPTLDMSAGWSGYAREAGNTDYLIQQTDQRLKSQIESCEAVNYVITHLTKPLPPQDCAAAFEFTPEMRQQILESNDAFPFDYSAQPFHAQLRVSLPIFQGFSRQRDVERARVATEDARHRLRAEELRLKTEIGAAHRNLNAARQTVALETRNLELAEKQLQLARERYRVGQTSFLELSQAETLMAEAENAYLAARYGFHEALAALEAAVGTRLQTPGEN